MSDENLSKAQTAYELSENILSRELSSQIPTPLPPVPSIQAAFNLATLEITNKTSAQIAAVQALTTLQNALAMIQIAKDTEASNLITAQSALTTATTAREIASETATIKTIAVSEAEAQNAIAINAMQVAEEATQIAQTAQEQAQEQAQVEKDRLAQVEKDRLAQVAQELANFNVMINKYIINLKSAPNVKQMIKTESVNSYNKARAAGLSYDQASKIGDIIAKKVNTDIGPNFGQGRNYVYVNPNKLDNAQKETDKLIKEAKALQENFSNTEENTSSNIIWYIILILIIMLILYVMTKK